MLANVTYKLKLSREAQSDISNIATWSHDRFGPQRTMTYLDALDRATQRVLNAPHAFPTRVVFDDVSDIRTYAVKFTQARARHILLYRVTGNAMELLRVLHEKMDIKSKASDYLEGPREDDQLK